MSLSRIWNNFTSTGDSFPELMMDIERHFTTVMKESSKVPEEFWDHISAFIAAVNWREPWIIGLISSHILLFVTVILMRKYHIFQVLVFMIICCCISLSEILNSYCADNWRLFATQNYFDKHGAFASTFFSGPLLLIGFTQLVNNH